MKCWAGSDKHVGAAVRVAVDRPPWVVEDTNNASPYCALYLGTATQPEVGMKLPEVVVVPGEALEAADPR
jgi:hypothetical protein